MKLVIILTIIGAVFLGGVALYMIRTMKHTPIEKWHVDPMTAPSPTTPNFYRVGPRDGQTAPVDENAPIYAATPLALAEAIHDFAVRQRDTRLIAGLPNELWMTFVQRTEVLKFPDYISVKVIALEDGRTTLSIFSRARVGYGDMGVNRARVEAWLEALRPLEAPAAPPASEEAATGEDEPGTPEPAPTATETDPESPDPAPAASEETERDPAPASE